MNGILIGITERGVTTSSAPGTASVRENQTARVSHFLAFLRNSYGSYAEAMRHLPEIQRILEWAGIALSGGFEHHRLPSGRVFHVLADSPEPSLETVRQSLVTLRLQPSGRDVGKYLKASHMAAARVNRWLDQHPAWDHYTCQETAA